MDRFRNKKNPKDPWDEDIEKKVSADDQIKFKDTAKKTVKLRKARSIIFFSLGAAAAAIIIGLAVGIKQTKEPLKLWDSSANIFLVHQAKYDKDKNPNGILAWDDNITINGKPEDIMRELFSNLNLLDNSILKPLNFKLIEPNVKATIANVILDLIDKKTLHFDIQLSSQSKNPEFKVIRNFTIKTSEETNIATNQRIISHNSNSRVQSSFNENWKLNFFTTNTYRSDDLNNKNKIEIKKILDNINKNKNLNYIDRSLLIQNEFTKGNYFFRLTRELVATKEKTKFFFIPFKFNGDLTFVETDSDGNGLINPEIRFNASFFSLANSTIRIKGEKYEYGLYLPYLNSQEPHNIENKDFKLKVDFVIESQKV
ncbi:hypothetical protein DA803_01490 [[Mycoplasma] phocae]|uniref:Uncharacterized protein n=1 Tax=[Mycoplasma] phocae TaxID=142651 RepID=A0A2Z5ISK5_9BACT|nr:hypothetical protein [[Mycoplasma] phocae]AXE60758.1 hypothetical protein DA803_01490 [[Mycoplasma] phocae]